MEYKWLLIFDPVNSHLPAPSADAKPYPKHLAQKSRDTVADASDETPKAGQPFSDPNSAQVWSEFHTCRAIRNPAQTKVDLEKSKQLWFYIGKGSTDTKAQFTGDLAKPVNDLDANFLDSVRPLPPPYVAPPPIQRRSYPATYPTGTNMHAANAAGLPKQYQPKPAPKSAAPKERPYNGKYAVPDPKPYQYKPKDNFNPEIYSTLNKRSPHQIAPSQPQAMYNNVPAYRAPPAPMAPMAPMMPAASRPASQQYNKPVDYRRVSLLLLKRIWDLAADKSQPSSQTIAPAQPHTLPPSQLPPRPQAPVANMMASSVPPRKIPSRPPSVTPQPVANPIALLRDAQKGISNLDIPVSWLYLHRAEKERPKTYQSPYAAKQAFAAIGLPANSTSSCEDPSKPSLSETFLMQRTLSQQEQVRGHIRKTSDARNQMQKERLRQQPEEINAMTQRKRESTEQQLHQNRLVMAHTNINSLPAPHHQHRYPDHSPIHSYNDMSTTYNHHHYPDPYAANPHAHSPTHYGNPFTANANRLPSPWSSNPSPPGSAGLQYESPQNFKLSMQREAQRQAEWASKSPSFQRPDFDNFYRGLQSAAAGHSSDALNGVNGGQGSPLKYEMHGGGEMLPMMRDTRVKEEWAS